MTRDSVLPFVGLLASAATFIAGHMEKFPYIPTEYQGTLELAAFLAASAFGVLTASPLRHSANQSADGFDVKKIFGR